VPSQDWKNWRKLRRPRPSLARFAWRWPMLVLVLSLAGLTLTSRHWQPLLISWRLQQKLDAATDREAAVFLRQAMEFGSPGMASVVEQLDSRRRAIRNAALRALTTEIESWPNRSTEQAERRSAQLAQALAEKVEGLGPLSRAQAAQLARDILRYSADRPADQRGPLVAACGRVLAVAARRGDAFDAQGALAAADQRSRADGSADPAADPSSVGGKSSSRSDLHPLGESDASNQLSPLPGGGLPVGPLPGPRLSPEEERLAQEGAPRLLEIHEPIKPLEPIPGHARFDGIATASAATTSALDAADEPPLPPADSDGGPRETANPDEPSGVMRLLAQLRDADADVATDARRKLVQRGFTPGQIEIGMHLTAADARERLRWTEVLPRYVGIETKPWLLWLSRDADADVRLAAASLMATTSDPQMLERVRQLARDDEDPRVREMAQRIGGRATSAERR
jgi:HEAT repeats